MLGSKGTLRDLGVILALLPPTSLMEVDLKSATDRPGDGLPSILFTDTNLRRLL